MTPDARLLKGDFCNPKFSLEQNYLTNYFQSELSICFVKYFLEFEDLRKVTAMREFCRLFTDHTGMDCHDSNKHYLFNKITELLAAEKKAQEDFDVDALLAIKDGKYKFRCKH